MLSTQTNLQLHQVPDHQGDLVAQNIQLRNQVFGLFDRLSGQNTRKNPLEVIHKSGINHVKLDLLDDAQSDFNGWMLIAESNISAYGLDDDLAGRWILTKLGPKALTNIKSYFGSVENLDFPTIKNYLIQQYKTADSDKANRSKVKELKQENKKLRQYVNEKWALVQMYVPRYTEEQKVDLVMDGMDPDVVFQMNSKPKTLMELNDEVKRREQFEGFFKNPVPTTLESRKRSASVHDDTRDESPSRKVSTPVKKSASPAAAQRMFQQIKVGTRFCHTLMKGAAHSIQD